MAARSALLALCRGAGRHSGAAAAAWAGVGAAAQQLQPLAATCLLECVVRQQQQPALMAWRRAASSSSGSGSEPAGASSGDAVADNLHSMLEAAMDNPELMQLMLSRMPPHMRKPEVLRAMLASPEVKARFAGLARDKGLDKVLLQMDVSKMAEASRGAAQAGLDPTVMLRRLQESPELAARMTNPRVMAALMDMATNGPQALKKYEGDAEVVEAAMEAGQMLTEMQQAGSKPGSGDDSAAAAASSSSSSADGQPASDARLIEQQLGAKPEELMARLMARPDLMARVSDPKVQAALMEVAQRPWMIVKYLFNKDVMAALKEMKELVGPPPKRQ